MDLRFNWYVNGIYHGYQRALVDIGLSDDGLEYLSTVNASRHLANGEQYAALCGQQVSERL